MVSGGKSGGRSARLSGARGAALVLAAAGAFVLLGCEERPDPMAQAIRDARNTLISVSGGGGGGLPAEERQKAYARVISSLEGNLKGSRSEGSSTVARLLIAQAQAGQAEIAASQQRALQSGVLLGLSQARALFELHMGLRAGASAMAAPTTTDIEEQITARLSGVERQLGTAEEAQRTATDFAADLRAAAERLSEQITSLRHEADALRAGATSMPPRERADQITRAVETDRRADAVEKDQAARLLELQEAESRVAQVTAAVEGLKGQRESLMKSRAQLADIGKAYQVSAGEARSEAEKTAEQVQQAVERVITTVKDELIPAWETATGKYQSAASSLGQARELQPQALSGTFDHAAAGLHLGFAETLEATVHLLERLADDDSGLPGRDAFRAAITDLRARHKEAIEKAGEAYAKAASSFQSARASGETGERLRVLAEQLERTGRKLRGEPEPAAEPSSDGSMNSEPAADAAPEAVEPAMGDDQAAPGVPSEEQPGSDDGSQTPPAPDDAGAAEPADPPPADGDEP